MEAHPMRRCLRCSTISCCCALSWCACCTISILISLAITVPVLLKQKPWIAGNPSFNLEVANATTPFVTVDWLVAHMAEGNVTLLDARPPPETFTRTPSLDKSIPGAVRAEWGEFMAGGKLMEADAMAEVFRAKGVKNQRPVVVYGGWSEPHHWGEEGRIWWQLHYLNHTSAYILYGGIWSWDSAVHKVCPPCTTALVACAASCAASRAQC
jgi:hypothetical protein